MKPIFAALLLSLFSSLAAADSTLLVEDAWVREAPPGARMLAAYMTLKNPTAQDLVLTGVDSPAFNHVMLHKSEVVDGVARMLHQDSILIPAGGNIELKPGSYHLMMPAPEQRLVEGDKVVFELNLEDQACVQVQAEVRKKP